MLQISRNRAAHCAAWALSASTLAVAASAHAQDAGPEADEIAANNEIVVSARKVDERLQDVPVTVTAIGADALQERGASSLQDVLRSVPGLSNSNAERGLSRYAIRGLSNGVSAPTVGIYLDDISLLTIATTFSGGLDPVFFDMQRVEVLKGPQGTLYGGSAMGGAIKYVSNTPDVNRFGVNAAAGLAFTAHGSPTYTGEAVLNAPLVPGTLAFRGGIYYRHDGGFIDAEPGDVQSSTRSSTPQPTYTPLQRNSLSTRQDKDINFSDTYAVRASLEWQPDASWSIRPQVFYQDQNLEDNGQFFINRDGFESSFRIAQPNHDESTIYSLNVDKDFGGAKLTSLTARFDRKFDYVRDYSFFVTNLVASIPGLDVFEPFVYPLTSANLSRSDVSTFSQELRLASNGNGPLQWLVGGYYSNQDDNLFQAVDAPGYSFLLGADRLYLGDITTKTKQYALFGEATYTLFDKLDLTAGVRVFKINQRVDALNDGPLNGGLTQVTGRLSKEDGVNPKVGLAYHFTRDNLLFANAAKGFRPGGPNRYPVNPVVCGADLAAIGLTAAPDTFDSDNLWTYEVGTKNLFGGGRVTLNGSAYLTKWKDIQQSIGLACGFGFTTNVGEAEIKGLELEGRVELMQGFEVGGNAAYTHAEVTDAAPGTPAVAGQEIPDVPKWTAVAFAGYSTDLANDWRFSLRGEYQYQGKARFSFDPVLPVLYPGGTYGAIPNASEFRESYEVVNAFASVGNDRTSVRLYVNNLFDTRPLLDLDLVTGSDKALTIRPRTVGMEVRQKF
ncbi:TonB-dependent receptor [Tsuneonella sp. HG094]